MLTSVTGAEECGSSKSAAVAGIGAKVQKLLLEVLVCEEDNRLLSESVQM